jgi:hypothetical protein
MVLCPYFDIREGSGRLLVALILHIDKLMLVRITVGFHMPLISDFLILT